RYSGITTSIQGKAFPYLIASSSWRSTRDGKSKPSRPTARKQAPDSPRPKKRSRRLPRTSSVRAERGATADRPRDPMADQPQHSPTIELDGARLRPLRVADADALYAYLRNPVVTELTSYPVASRPMAESIIERSLSRWAAGELSKWGVALQQDDQLV